jgi:hypothetical protein
MVYGNCIVCRFATAIGNSVRFLAWAAGVDSSREGLKVVCRELAAKYFQLL